MASTRSTSGGLSGPFITYPIATTLVMVGILFLGLVAYPLLPVAPLPQVDFPTIQVTANYPGASPETMASTVAQPLERQFSQIPDVALLTSQSTLGTTQITVQFELNRNIDAAAQDVQAAINAAGGQLPRDLPSPPTYRKVNPADPPIMIIAVTSDTMPLIQVDDAADTKLAQQLSQVEGVGQVFVGGEQKPAIRIQVDPARLMTKGLSLEDIRGPLAAATVNAPKGSVDGVRRAFTIYANDQLTDPDKWRDVIVAFKAGAPIRVRDIGDAVAGPEDAKKVGWASGRRGVYLVVFKQPGANVIQTVDRITAELPRLQASIPPAVRVEVSSDRTQTIRASVLDVELTLLLTIGLVVAVIFVFLRSVWATLIPSVTVPLALFGTAALMFMPGYSLDNLSLMALTISVGFVVDDAIVMLENIVRHVEDGDSPMEAARKGAGEIGFTVLSISISLIAVFIPLLFMGGIIGRLFREFAVVVTMMIAVSAFVSLTLTPMMASRLLPPARKDETHGRVYRALERFFDALEHGYERGLDVVLAWRRATLLVFFATIGVTAFLFVTIPKGFFPQQDTGFIVGTSEAAQDVSFAEMTRIQEELNEVIGRDPAVAAYTSSVGGNTGALNTGRIYVTLKPHGDRDVSADGIIARLRPQLERVRGARMFLQASQDINVGGRQSRTQYQYTIQDADLSELNEWAPRIFDRMKTLGALRDVATDQQIAGSTLTLTIDRDEAARWGIRPQLIDDTLNDAFGQRQIAQYFTQLNSYHVVLEVLPALQADTETLQRLYITSPTTGEQVPLANFVSWTTRKLAPLSISHQGQFPAVTLSFNLAEGTSLSDATRGIEDAMRDLGAPGTIVGSFQGNAQAFQRSLSTVPLLILAALVVVYLILGILYESFIHPLTILSTLPSAGLGALASLMVGGFDFSLIALIGVILLIGIVKKNGIMLVDFAITAERDEHLSSEDAIRRAAILRFRPIMMTTMAALLGGVPLMLGHGAGAEIRQPLGVAMVGGLIVSQALTLFTTPVVYLYLDHVSATVARWRGRPRDAARTDEGPDAHPAPAE